MFQKSIRPVPYMIISVTIMSGLSEFKLLKNRVMRKNIYTFHKFSNHSLELLEINNFSF